MKALNNMYCVITNDSISIEGLLAVGVAGATLWVIWYVMRQLRKGEETSSNDESLGE